LQWAFVSGSGSSVSGEVGLDQSQGPKGYGISRDVILLDFFSSACRSVSSDEEGELALPKNMSYAITPMLPLFISNKSIDRGR
jgi:hypothetical protein